MRIISQDSWNLKQQEPNTSLSNETKKLKVGMDLLHYVSEDSKLDWRPAFALLRSALFLPVMFSFSCRLLLRSRHVVPGSPRVTWLTVPEEHRLFSTSHIVNSGVGPVCVTVLPLVITVAWGVAQSGSLEPVIRSFLKEVTGSCLGGAGSKAGTFPYACVCLCVYVLALYTKPGSLMKAWGKHQPSIAYVMA